MEDLGEKYFFWDNKSVKVKNCIIIWYIYCKLYGILLQICSYAQKRRIVAKIANTGLTKILEGIIALAKRLPTSATLI